LRPNSIHSPRRDAAGNAADDRQWLGGCFRSLSRRQAIILTAAIGHVAFQFAACFPVGRLRQLRGLFVCGCVKARGRRRNGRGGGWC